MYCNCYELTGKQEYHVPKFKKTETCKRGICKYCGYYAVKNIPERHMAETFPINWESQDSIAQNLDITVLAYYYSEQEERRAAGFSSKRSRYYE